MGAGLSKGARKKKGGKDGAGQKDGAAGDLVVDNAMLDNFIVRLMGAKDENAKTFCLQITEITALCQRVRNLLLEEASLVEIDAPVNICGDIHGQYSDLLRLFELCGYPDTTNYLFLGDYVDRGKQSLEAITLLFCFKIKYPKTFHLLRGNHEASNVNRVYGFFDECKRRTSIKCWKTYTDVFNCLPIAGLVAKKIFCVHGGLSPYLSTMDDIRKIKRPIEIPDSGMLNDLLWSDPSADTEGWESSDRGVSYVFGKKVLEEFLDKHNFDLVCRAHMVVEDGYEFFADRMLVTIFSAPNYCGEFNNVGAILKIDTSLTCSFVILKGVARVSNANVGSVVIEKPPESPTSPASTTSDQSEKR